jgi:hypothetical protein
VGLSFHLTEAEKKDLAAAVYSASNQQQFAQLLRWLINPTPVESN